MAVWDYEKLEGMGPSHVFVRGSGTSSMSQGSDIYSRVVMGGTDLYRL